LLLSMQGQKGKNTSDFQRGETEHKSGIIQRTFGGKRKGGYGTRPRRGVTPNKLKKNPRPTVCAHRKTVST